MTAEESRAEAVKWWSNYEADVVFETPWFLKGVVEALREVKNRDGDWVPRVAVRGELAAQEDQFTGAEKLLLVTAHPSRLRAELILAAPAVGDRIWITYLGEDDRSMPKGYSKTKRFQVIVKPPASPPPPAPDGTSGKVAPTDNGSEAGK